jgi:hypothetical protein
MVPKGGYKLGKERNKAKWEKDMCKNGNGNLHKARGPASVLVERFVRSV